MLLFFNLYIYEFTFFIQVQILAWAESFPNLLLVVLKISALEARYLNINIAIVNNKKIESNCIGKKLLYTLTTRTKLPSVERVRVAGLNKKGLTPEDSR